MSNVCCFSVVSDRKPRVCASDAGSALKRSLGRKQAWDWTVTYL